MSNVSSPSAYGIPMQGIQQYLPISDEKRDFSHKEQIQIQEGKDQWIPAIGAGFSTPLPQLLASPAKSGIINGSIWGGITLAAFLLKCRSREREVTPRYSHEIRSMLADTSDINHYVVASKPFTFKKMMIGSALVSSVAAVTGIFEYIKRKQNNNNILDEMQRLPEGATKRDMLADPVIEQDENRSAMIRAGALSGRNNSF